MNFNSFFGDMGGAPGGAAKGGEIDNKSYYELLGVA